jgi:hypothetical protein
VWEGQSDATAALLVSAGCSGSGAVTSERKALGEVRALPGAFYSLT